MLYSISKYIHINKQPVQDPVLPQLIILYPFPLEYGMPVTLIGEAVFARCLSSIKVRDIFVYYFFQFLKIYIFSSFLPKILSGKMRYGYLCAGFVHCVIFFKNKNFLNFLIFTYNNFYIKNSTYFFDSLV